MAGGAFDSITRSYYEAWFRYHPEAAVDVGVAGYESLLTPQAAEERGALVSLNDSLVVSLDELDETELDPDARLDYAILRGAAMIENERILEVDSRCLDPGRFLPINAIYQLTIRPVADFSAALMARLQAIPEHLKRAQVELRVRAAAIPRLWLDSAIVAARHGANFISGLNDPRIPQAAIADVERARTQAAQALVVFADFMAQALSPAAAGQFACGRRYFENLLRLRHFLDCDIEELQGFGDRLIEKTKRELAQECQKLCGSDDMARALVLIRRDHPSSAELLKTYREQMQAARQFVMAHDLVSAPSVESLDIVETPGFLRHQIPFAAYTEPTPGDSKQHGYYYVTPPQDAEELAEHDFAGLMHTCVHEAWPGHHLQFVTANLNPASRSLPRLLNPSSMLYEGWALYSEQLMFEQGFLRRPEQRFILLRDRLWRALRIAIDIGIHTRGLGLENAADLMVRLLGFPRSQAMADLTWYTRSPTVPLGYATGWALINGLRERLARRPDFTLKEFHDRLLSAGSVALPAVIRRVFGEEHWRAVRSGITGGGTHATS